MHSDHELVSRQKLDRRRLEEAYIQYAVLKVCQWYPSIQLKDESFHEGTSSLLSHRVAPEFHTSFVTKYAG